MSQKPYYLTTPIYYVNSHPHLGHAYTTIVADSSVRFHKQLGERTLLLTGTDEHGDKIAQAAEAKDLTPAKFVDEISSQFCNLWPNLSVKVDHFTRTTSESHIKKVQELLQKLYNAGDIYFGEFGGYYCYGCERFYTEKELENGLCPQHLKAPQFISEKNYFFRMSSYIPWLRQYIEDNPQLIRPERYRREALGMLDSGELEDLCISRPKSRLQWGIELPFDKDFVCYVWFDALASYITGLDWPDGEEFQTFWPGEHLIAKDILKPHAIFWPCMLKAAGLPVYRHLNVHGYWLIRDTKMSKSLGNVVEPLAAVEEYGLDCFRYFLLREMRFGSDASFSSEAVITRINADLANDLGNLYSRVLSMVNRYFDKKTPQPVNLEATDHILIGQCGQAMQNYIQLFNNMECSLALESIMEFCQSCNKYVDTQAPWTLYKDKNFTRLETVLSVLLAALRKIAICLWPVMPDAASKMMQQLGERNASPERPVCVNLEEQAKNFEFLSFDTVLSESSNLFPRIEQDKKQPEKEKKDKKAKEKGLKIDAYNALGITCGKILKVSRHPNANKILCLEIDFAEYKPRQILSGIAEYYSPEDLTGKMICAVLNLAPRNIRGLTSNGMILTVETEDGLKLLDPGQNSKPGTPVI